jgi:cell division protein FtsI (penicillin-binding protein 3)
MWSGFTNVEDRGQEVSNSPTSASSPAGRQPARDQDRLGRVIENDWLRAGRREDMHCRSTTAFSTSRFGVKSGCRGKHQRTRVRRSSSTCTAAVAALANWPSYDPNARGRLSGDAIRNRVITDTFEPGSTMKPFSIGGAGSGNRCGLTRESNGSRTAHDRRSNDRRRASMAC